MVFLCRSGPDDKLFRRSYPAKDHDQAQDHDAHQSGAKLEDVLWTQEMPLEGSRHVSFGTLIENRSQL